jgi:hypothetical protein
MNRVVTLNAGGARHAPHRREPAPHTYRFRPDPTGSHQLDPGDGNSASDAGIGRPASTRPTVPIRLRRWASGALFAAVSAFGVMAFGYVGLVDAAPQYDPFGNEDCVNAGGHPMDCCIGNNGDWVPASGPGAGTSSMGACAPPGGSKLPPGTGPGGSGGAGPAGAQTTPPDVVPRPQVTAPSEVATVPPAPAPRTTFTLAPANPG